MRIKMGMRRMRMSDEDPDEYDDDEHDAETREV